MLGFQALAAQGGGGEPIVTLIGVVIILIMAAVVLNHESNARYNVVIRNGLPYCPRCNRQVSYRRDFCRACGYQFVTYETGPGRARDGSTGRAESERHRQRTELIRQAMAQRATRYAADLAARRERRGAYYRERGVEPGPWAWYHVRPDWQQAVILGLAFATPIVGLILLLMRWAT